MAGRGGPRSCAVGGAFASTRLLASQKFLQGPRPLHHASHGPPSPTIVGADANDLILAMRSAPESSSRAPNKVTNFSPSAPIFARECRRWMPVASRSVFQATNVRKQSKEAERRETRSPRSAPFGMRRAQSAARSPFGVPPRHSLQRTNATAQPQLRASWDGTREERVLPAPGRPAVQRSLDRRPVIVPAGRIRQGRPGTAVTSCRPREPTPAPPYGVTA